MQEILIRRATPKDTRRISYLIKKNADFVKENKYTKDQLLVWKRANTSKAIIKKLKNRIFFCAFQNNKLIGTIGLEGKTIVGLYISYSKRGQGLGAILLRYIEKFARESGIQELDLTATPNGFGFYRKHGYQTLNEVTLYYEGVEFLETKMVKKIKAKYE